MANLLRHELLAVPISADWWRIALQSLYLSRLLRICGPCVTWLCSVIALGSFFTAAHADEPAKRTTQGLQAFYTFEASEDGLIQDKSGVGEPLHLRIDKPQGIAFAPGKLVVHTAVTISCDGPAKKLIQACKQTNEVTIESWLTPFDERQSGPARIVSLSTNPGERNLTLGQDKAKFDIRLRTTERDNNGMPSLPGTENISGGKQKHVVFTRSKEGVAKLYVDQQEVASGNAGGNFGNWNDDYRLVIANEASGDRPWIGEFHLVAIFDRALSVEEVKQNFVAGPPAAVDYSAMLPPAWDGEVSFVKDIQPIFRKHCFECHSADQEDGGVNLGIRERALQGGDHGPIFVAGNSANSRLIHLVAAVNKAKTMPPDSEGLSKGEIALLRKWIDSGAEWPTGVDVADPRVEKAHTHWAFQPLHDVPLPDVKRTDWIQTPIDRFILAKLENSGIAPSERTTAQKFIRRVTFDLIGLPPTPEEIASFCQEAEKDWGKAVEALVTRLLESPHYGERWGRHWLDVARYADSDGQESDRDRNTAYHYRDFVIRAFQKDMPYDQFVRWQLAGDEYEPDNPEAVAALGFLAAGPFAALPDKLMEDERLRNRYNELDDMLSTIGTGFLGLTLGCVRCHDHKYDAIPARDYYSLMSAFHGGERAEIPLGKSDEKVLGYRDLGAEPRPTWLFQRGNYYDRDQPLSLGFVSILVRGKTPEDYWKEAREKSPSKQSTGQRRAMADWMTDVEHGAGALLARVIVNRVWQHHFGIGLVRTPGDFGVRSETPTHPELLEWLANDLVKHGWKLKRLQQMIVQSAVYQQGTRTQVEKGDPDNRLLWRAPLVRLEGEILRDSMLAASGTLNKAAFGPSVRPPIASEAILARNVKDPYPDKIADGPELRRRSIYLFHKRVVPYPLLQAFDKPDAQQSCSRRDRTTVAPQALALMNDPFVRTVSLEFADRLLKENSDAISEVIQKGYLLSLGRNATKEELVANEAFIQEQIDKRSKRDTKLELAVVKRQAVADFCQVLFSLNEFLYVD